MQWTPGTDAPPGTEDFFADYAVGLCFADLGHLEASNYADIEASFILYDRPPQTLQMFLAHPDTVKQCLLVVGRLDSPANIRRVHEYINWSGWHESIPCIGESQTGKFAISDTMGNKKPYYDERIRLAIYYCKAPEMMTLEIDLNKRLEGKDPRDGLGALNASSRGLANGRRNLCIFVPSSARKQRFIDAAEAAMKHWGTENTFFVSPSRLSASLDPHTLLLETDMDTDYAHLPVRTLLLFEALGQPEWVQACDWYMKADADSFVNVPLIIERLRCFDPGELWFLGVPQVAHGSNGALTRFASGGAGYIISRALAPKVAAWAPFCLLQQLQHSGGTGMEDVVFSQCLYKWGHIRPVNYVDPETEVITSELQANRTRVAHTDGPHAVPPCTFIVHSLTPVEVATAHQNIQLAKQSNVDNVRCQPDEERLQSGSVTLLAPLAEGMTASDDHKWPVYGDREFRALLNCSRRALAAG